MRATAEPAAIVGDLAAGLSSALPDGQWHLGMPAFEVLAKLDPDKAKQIMKDAAVTSDVWQVRAAAARVATTLKDEAMLIRLADDRIRTCRRRRWRACSA